MKRPKCFLWVMLISLYISYGNTPNLFLLERRLHYLAVHSSINSSSSEKTNFEELVPIETEYPDARWDGRPTRALVMSVPPGTHLSIKAWPQRSGEPLTEEEQQVFEAAERNKTLLTPIQEFDLSSGQVKEVKQTFYNRKDGKINLDVIVIDKAGRKYFLQMSGANTNDLQRLKQVMTPLSELLTEEESAYVSMGNQGDIKGNFHLQSLGTQGWKFYGAVDEPWPGKSYRALIELKDGTRSLGMIRMEGNPKTNRIQRVHVEPFIGKLEKGYLNPEQVEFVLVAYALIRGDLSEYYDETSDLRHLIRFPYINGQSVFHDQVAGSLENLRQCFKNLSESVMPEERKALILKLRDFDRKELDAEQVSKTLLGSGYQFKSSKAEVKEPGDFFIEGDTIWIILLSARYPINGLAIGPEGEASFVWVGGASGREGANYWKFPYWLKQELKGKLGWEPVAFFIFDNGMDPSWGVVRQGQMTKPVQGRPVVNALMSVVGLGDIRRYREDVKPLFTFLDDVHDSIVKELSLDTEMAQIAKQSVQLYYERAAFLGMSSELEKDLTTLAGDSRYQFQTQLFRQLSERRLPDEAVFSAILSRLEIKKGNLEGLLAKVMLYFSSFANGWNHKLGVSGQYHYTDLGSDYKENPSLLYDLIHELLKRQREAKITFKYEEFLNGLRRRRLDGADPMGLRDKRLTKMIRIGHNDWGAGATVGHPHQHAVFITSEFIPEGKFGIERCIADYPDRILWHSREDGYRIGEFFGWPMSVGIVEGDDFDTVAEKVYELTQRLHEKEVRFNVLLSTTEELRPRFLVFARFAGEENLKIMRELFGHAGGTFDIAGALITPNEEKFFARNSEDVIRAFSAMSSGPLYQVLELPKPSETLERLSPTEFGKYIDLFLIPSRDEMSRLQGVKGSKPGDFLAYWHWPPAEKALRLDNQFSIVPNVRPPAPHGIVIFSQDMGPQELSKSAIKNMLVVWMNVRASLEDERESQGIDLEALTQVIEQEL